MASERCCHGCRAWYDAKLRACSACGRSRYDFSSHLYTAKLNDHLYKAAESAEREKKQYRAIRQGYEIPPTKAQYKLARQLVADM